MKKPFATQNAILQARNSDKDMGKFKKDNERAAKQELLDDIFDDLYRNRPRVYKVNFVRGIFFGLGSALGGTVIVALIVWILTFFIQIPGVGSFLDDAQNNIEQKTQGR